MTTHADDTLLRVLNLPKRETDAERIARLGWEPFVACSYCGDTGINPGLTTYDKEGKPTLHECHCAVGTAMVTQATRAAIWHNTIPSRFQDYTLAGHPNAALAEAVGAWIDSNPCRTGQNLVLLGGTGRGKTGAAIAALREMHFQGATVRYWSLPDLMDQLRADEFGKKDDLRKQPTMNYLIDCDCLLLDDLGTERPTAYVADRLYVIINGRYSENRPTIFTTNHDRDKLAHHLDQRNVSRIDENVRYLTASGPDLRRTK